MFGSRNFLFTKSAAGGYLPFEAGQLWSWGGGGNGQLGTGSTVNRSSPVQVGSLATWKYLSSGVYCVGQAIKSDNTMWAWGLNDAGQLGQGNTTGRSSPVQIGTDWASPVVGSQYVYGRSMAAVKTNGTLWVWGKNNVGQLGLGNTTYYSSPKQVGSDTNWLSVSATHDSMVAVKTNGTIFSWGANGKGQLGLGNTTTYSSPKQIGSGVSWAKLVMGRQMCVGIKTDGTLWTWGWNLRGALGLGNSTDYSSPKQVGSLATWRFASGGNFHTMAIKTDGTLWGWGGNYAGQLGLGTTSGTNNSPVQIGSDTNWRKVSAAMNFTLAVKTNGKLYSCGYGNNGVLGLGDTLGRSSLTQIGTDIKWQDIGNATTYTSFAIKKV
jgi:alpha-tubulin suppressor-like RCC1 family protein